MNDSVQPNYSNQGDLQAKAKAMLRTGWGSLLARLSISVLLFELLTGLAISFAPFHASVQWGALLHTLIGVLTLLPLAWYCAAHWQDYRRYAVSQVTLLGYVGLIGLFVCSVSGTMITGQALFGIKTSWLWRKIHFASTFVTLAGLAPHVLSAWVKSRQSENKVIAGKLLWSSVLCTAALIMGIALSSVLYSGTRYVNAFPQDYSFLYGKNRPFAPSLARTDTGGAFDARSISGSTSCGTVGCHEEIVKEWKPSAHRYAAMDTVFAGIQNVMAKQNGPESTRYCGGCHDPISLFSGTKNLFVENLTGLAGYQEGVSCLVCHAIRETDIKGNANYVVTQPPEYLWQWNYNGLGRVVRDFLIRACPDEHNKLSKRAFKKPEYCAACHKQFIDQEVNRVGWVQLQNQYDNWAASHWNHKGDAQKTIECRECHMPLVDSHDPGAGDAMDYNRNPKDHKHRSHRFIASNQLMPVVLKDKLEGWQEQVRQTEQWLQGKTPVPEIQSKWAEGPIVKLALTAPQSVAPGQDIPLRVIIASNKVGHDFPTGPLDIIQSWLEVTVTDNAGRIIFTSGKRDQKNFIEPGSFLFKAEPVDQNGNLIDRHNLWEMVGVRYRRAIFPGYSDTAQYSIPCSGVLTGPSSNAVNQGPSTIASEKKPLELTPPPVPAPAQPGSYDLQAVLLYRKVDQFLLNYLFGEQSGLTSPVTELARATTKVFVKEKPLAAADSQAAK
jgi:hypothetical protein